MIYAVPFGGGQKSKHILPVHHRPRTPDFTSADRGRKEQCSPRVKIPPGKS